MEIGWAANSEPLNQKQRREYTYSWVGESVMKAPKGEMQANIIKTVVVFVRDPEARRAQGDLRHALGSHAALEMQAEGALNEGPAPQIAFMFAPKRYFVTWSHTGSEPPRNLSNNCDGKKRISCIINKIIFSLNNVTNLSYFCYGNAYDR